jgi:hypothetical protein
MSWRAKHTIHTLTTSHTRLISHSVTPETWLHWSCRKKPHRWWGWQHSSLPLSIHFCIPRQQPQSYINQHKVLGAGESCHSQQLREQNGQRTGGKYQEMHKLKGAVEGTYTQDLLLWPHYSNSNLCCSGIGWHDMCHQHHTLLLNDLQVQDQYPCPPQPWLHFWSLQALQCTAECIYWSHIWNIRNMTWCLTDLYGSSVH